MSDCGDETLDIMFVLDGSASVGSKNFKLVKEWTKEVAARFRNSDKKVQIGVVQYSNYDPSR